MAADRFCHQLSGYHFSTHYNNLAQNHGIIKKVMSSLTNGKTTKIQTNSSSIKKYFGTHTHTALKDTRLD